jgi:hypothetical protein
MGSDQKLFVREGDAWLERRYNVGIAERLSRELHTIVVEWSISTTVDQVWIVAYRDGSNVMWEAGML